jgi:hypothetical protein
MDLNQWQTFVLRVTKFRAMDSRRPATVTARSEASTVFDHSNTGIVGSNPTKSMDVSVCLFCVCTAQCAGSGLAMG